MLYSRRKRQRFGLRTGSRRKADTEETAEGQGKRPGKRGCGSPAPWCAPRAPGCGWSRCAPSPRAAGGTAGAGGGRGERAGTQGAREETPQPTGVQGPGRGVGGHTECQSGTSGERPGAQEAHGTKLRPPLSSECGFQVAIPGSPWLQAFIPVLPRPWDGRAFPGAEMPRESARSLAPCWKQTWAAGAFAWRTVSPQSFHWPLGLPLARRCGGTARRGTRQGTPIQEGAGEAGPTVPPESGWGRPCALSELGGGGTSGHTCGSHRHGHARTWGACGGGQQHEQYPAGAWLGLWPSW